MAYTDIDKPSDYFETKLYTGNGGTLNVTGLDFSPNWVWIKSRSSSRVHCLFDTVRGATKRLQTNEGDAEATTSNSLTGFNSDGFSLGSYNQSNEGSANFVSWNWLGANGTASNSNGNITSTVSASATAGFSIVKWTGNNSGSATVGHGLGTIPNVVIIKKLDGTSNWGFKHSSFASGAMAPFNTVDAPSNRNGSTNGGIGNLTSSSTFGFIAGGAGTPSENNGSMIAYCFSERKGYSKFSSYVGNGNADGPFVYTGFKPAYVLVKAMSGSASYTVLDNKRNPFNPMGKGLFPDSAQAEYDYTNRRDYYSNGFKIRNTSSAENSSGTSYAYMAFAENPFVTSTGIPATAR